MVSERLLIGVSVSEKGKVVPKKSIDLSVILHAAKRLEEPHGGCRTVSVYSVSGYGKTVVLFCYGAEEKLKRKNTVEAVAVGNNATLVAVKVGRAYGMLVLSEQNAVFLGYPSMSLEVNHARFGKTAGLLKDTHGGFRFSSVYTVYKNRRDSRIRSGQIPETLLK